MRNLKTLLPLSVLALLLLGGESGWLGSMLMPMAFAQEVPKEARVEDPTNPADYLYQESNPALIQDEPLVVTVPAGLPPLTPKVVVPAGNPITKGKVRTGPSALLRPPYLA